MIDGSTNPRRRYTGVYAFSGSLSDRHADVVTLITETVAEMQRDGIDIEFLGATQELDSAGRVTEVTVRYAAPNKGTIGRLNCRARLPASEQPRRETDDSTPEPSGRRRRPLPGTR